MLKMCSNFESITLYTVISGRIWYLLCVSGLGTILLARICWLYFLLRQDDSIDGLVLMNSTRLRPAAKTTQSGETFLRLYLQTYRSRCWLIVFASQGWHCSGTSLLQGPTTKVTLPTILHYCTVLRRQAPAQTFFHSFLYKKMSNLPSWTWSVIRNWQWKRQVSLLNNCIWKNFLF